MAFKQVLKISILFLVVSIFYLCTLTYIQVTQISVISFNLFTAYSRPWRGTIGRDQWLDQNLLGSMTVCHKCFIWFKWLSAQACSLQSKDSLLCTVCSGRPTDCKFVHWYTLNQDVHQGCPKWKCLEQILIFLGQMDICTARSGMHEAGSAEGGRSGRGLAPSWWGGVWGATPRKFWNFNLKMVRFGGMYTLFWQLFCNGGGQG